MTRFGLKLMSELHDPRSLVEQARIGRDAGMAFASISDHIHPWLGDHHHSPFAWSVLGGIAAAVPDLELATGVTCPIGRYHPVVVAHAAATVATMSDKPFTLAVGAGERLNEHVTGEGFPAVDLRHERLREACDILSMLWEGGFGTYRGDHFDAEDVRIYDLPEQPIRLVVAVSGPASLEVADDVDADGIMCNEPDAALVEAWGGDGSPGTAWSEVPIAWAPTAEEGLRLAHERFRFAAQGWKVMSELPNPVNFDAATSVVSPEDMADLVPHGPDPAVHAEAIRAFVDAGFTELALIPVSDDVEGTLRFFAEEVQPLL